MNPLLIFAAVASPVVFLATFGYVVASLMARLVSRDRSAPSEAKTETVRVLLQASGIATLGFDAVALAQGMASGRVAEVIDPNRIGSDLHRYWHAFLGSLAPTLSGLGALVLLVAVLVIAMRHGRHWMAVWWRYKRRWARVLRPHGLTGTDRKRVTVPQLHTVVVGGTADVLTIALLPGQSPDDWRYCSAQLAAAFGRRGGHVRQGPNLGEIDLVLTHTRGGTGARRSAAVAAPRPGDRQLVALVRGWSLQISWARIQVCGHNDSTRTRYRGRLRWITMASSYILVGGL